VPACDFSCVDEGITMYNILLQDLNSCIYNVNEKPDNFVKTRHSQVMTLEEPV